MWEVFLPIVGFIIGLAVMVGLGGGFLVVPLLALVYSFSPANAVGTGLTVVLMTALAASTYYWKQKQIYYRIGLTLGIVSVPGAILGSYLTSKLSGQVIGLLVSVCLLFVAWQIYNKRNDDNCEDKLGSNSSLFERNLFSQRKAALIVGVILSFFAGLCGGLLGIPGVLLVPIMIIVLRMPFKAVAATSVFTLIFLSLTGVVEHIHLGNVNLEYALLIGSGSIFGGLVGAHFCKISGNKRLTWILSGLLVFVSLLLFLKFGLGFLS